MPIGKDFIVGRSKPKCTTNFRSILYCLVGRRQRNNRTKIKTFRNIRYSRSFANIKIKDAWRSIIIKVCTRNKSLQVFWCAQNTINRRFPRYKNMKIIMSVFLGMLTVQLLRQRKAKWHEYVCAFVLWLVVCFAIALL